MDSIQTTGDNLISEAIKVYNYKQYKNALNNNKIHKFCRLANPSELFYYQVFNQLTTDDEKSKELINFILNQIANDGEKIDGNKVLNFQKWFLEFDSLDKKIIIQDMDNRNVHIIRKSIKTGDFTGYDLILHGGTCDGFLYNTSITIARAILFVPCYIVMGHKNFFEDEVYFYFTLEKTKRKWFYFF
jgi:hypothetical protein